MEKEIGRIKKNDNTDIVIRIDDFGGKPGITIREFVTSERYTGFTKSGTRIPVENFEEFKSLIDDINEDDLKALEESREESDSQEELDLGETRKEAESAEEEVEEDSEDEETL